MSCLARAIDAYYRCRGLKWPTTEQALMFAQTELGEVYELLLARESGWVRNNPDDKPEYSDQALAEELGDTVMMLIVAGLAAGVDPIEALLDKMEEKAWTH